MTELKGSTDLKTKFKDLWLQNGNYSGLAEHEILEFLLYKCNCTKNTEQIAADLLHTFGSLQGIIEANAYELQDTKLINDRAVDAFRMLVALCGYICEERFSKPVSCCDINTLKSFIKIKFNGFKVEKAMFFTVNSDLEVIDSTVEAVGNLQRIILDFPKIAKNTLNKKCKYLIMAHNHPHAPALPSDADILTTNDCIIKFKALGVCLLDHYIVGFDGINSMRMLGYFSDYE